ncbi:MAG: endonuclease domain-containing protein [Brevefilum sp.]
MLFSHPIPGLSPPEGEGTRAAGGKGLTSDGQPIKFDVSRQTRDALIEQARYMRQNPTKAENLLWQELRARKLGGFKFRRQHPIGTFIVDFYCPERKLVIEIDGPVHLQQIAYDSERETYLQRLGYYIIRFENDEVIFRIERVLKIISKVLSQPNNEGA